MGLLQIATIKPILPLFCRRIGDVILSYFERHEQYMEKSLSITIFLEVQQNKYFTPWLTHKKKKKH
jgi:hypothetical protein